MFLLCILYIGQIPEFQLILDTTRGFKAHEDSDDMEEDKDVEADEKVQVILIIKKEIICYLYLI